MIVSIRRTVQVASPFFILLTVMHHVKIVRKLGEFCFSRIGNGVGDNDNDDDDDEMDGYIYFFDAISSHCTPAHSST